jgi:hypothetical protein
MSIEAMKQALEALTHKKWFRIGSGEPNDPKVEAAITALRTAIERDEKQEPVACKTLCELCIKRGYNFCANAAKTTPIPTPLAAQPAPVHDQLAWQNLRNRIQADIDRTEGRWGMHGHSAVDNDYFTALEWVVKRMDEILSSTQRKPLTKKQCLHLEVHPMMTIEQVVRIVEAAHGITRREEMTKQTDAMRLADKLEDVALNAYVIEPAVAELRRLEGEIERKSDAIQRLWKERDDLRAVNAQLLEALHSISLASQDSGSTREGMGLYARAAIKAAKEQS